MEVSLSIRVERRDSLDLIISGLFFRSLLVLRDDFEDSGLADYSIACPSFTMEKLASEKPDVQTLLVLDFNPVPIDSDLGLEFLIGETSSQLPLLRAAFFSSTATKRILPDMVDSGHLSIFQRRCIARMLVR